MEGTMQPSLLPRCRGLLPLVLACSTAFLASCHLNPETPVAPLPASGASPQLALDQQVTHGNPGAVNHQEQLHAEPKLRLGANVGIASEEEQINESDYEETDSIEFAIELGYRMTPNFELGGLLEIGQVKESGSGIDTEEDRLLIGPQCRIYFTGEGAVQPWVAVAIGLARGCQSGTVITGGGGTISFEADGDGTFAQLGLGVSYFPTSWAALEASLNLREVSTDVDESGNFGSNYSYDYDISTTFFRIGLSIFF